MVSLAFKVVRFKDLRFNVRFINLLKFIYRACTNKATSKLFSLTCFVLIYCLVLTEKIEDLGQNLKSHFNIEEFSSISLPAQVWRKYL